MNLPVDATGVPVYPGDSSGYIIEGYFCTYKMGRAMLSSLAARYPSKAEECTRSARWLNETHLRRLLRQQPRVWADNGKGSRTYALPRAMRRRFTKWKPIEGQINTELKP